MTGGAKVAEWRREVDHSSYLECPECHEVQIIHRNKARMRSPGHIKDLWCPKCLKVTKHIEHRYHPEIEARHAAEPAAEQRPSGLSPKSPKPPLDKPRLPYKLVTYSAGYATLLRMFEAEYGFTTDEVLRLVDEDTIPQKIPPGARAVARRS